MMNRNGDSAQMDMEMSESDCAVMLRPEFSTDEDVSYLAMSANRIEFRNMTWLTDTGRNSFKMDIFVKPPVVDLYLH